MKDLRSLLNVPGIYRLKSDLICPPVRKARFVQEVVRPQAGDRVLDVGCGPAEWLRYFPSVDYLGFDSEPRVIADAKQRYGDRGRFFCETVRAANVPQAGTYDLVMAIGVLHHLDDSEAGALFELARVALRPGGRLITLDGAWVDGQGPIERWLLASDRGDYVRCPDEYFSLASIFGFATIDMSVITHLNRIPYTHCVLDAVQGDLAPRTTAL